MITEAVLAEIRIDPSDVVVSSAARWAGGRGAFVLSYWNPSHYTAEFIVTLESGDCSSPDLAPIVVDSANNPPGVIQRIVRFDLPPCRLRVRLEEMSGSNSAYPKVVVIPIGG